MQPRAILPSLEETKGQDLMVLKQMNWHGVTSKFFNQHKDRQFKDLTIFKSSKLSAAKAAKDLDTLVQKKKLQEYDHAQQLLHMKKKKEKAKNSRLITLLENNKHLDDQMKLAAVVIQRFARGYLIRKKYKDDLMDLAMKRLFGKVEKLEGMVEKCLKYIGDTVDNAAIRIQKNVRRFLQVKKYRETKEINHRSQEYLKKHMIILIQAHIRGFISRRRYAKLRSSKDIEGKLEKIRKRLLVLKLKEFWHRKKFVWATIQHKYSDKNESVLEINENPSEPLVLFLNSIKSNIPLIPSRLTSKKNTLLHKEPVNIRKTSENLPKVSKPPLIPPKQLTLKYLQPTATFISRTSQDTEELKTLKNYKIRTVSGRRFQKNTDSRNIYISEVQSSTIKRQRAASADYKRLRPTQTSFLQDNMKVSDKTKEEIVATSFISEFVREYKTKTPMPNLQLQRVEDLPAPINEEVPEKVYVYRPPKLQSISFKDALPDVNSLLEAYAKSNKK